MESNLVRRLGKLKIPGSVRFCFTVSFVLFLLIHFYWFKEKYMFADDTLVVTGWTWGYLDVGRWLLAFVREISGRYSIPWFTGMLSALYMAAALSLLVGIFEIQRKTAVFLTALSLIAFPAIAREVQYISHIDAMMLSLLLACAGCFFTLKRPRFGFLAGGLFFCLSMGIYQAYYTFAIPVLLFYILISCVRGEEGWFKNGLKSIGALLIGVVGYKLVLDVVLKLTQTEMKTGVYSGADTMWSFTPLTLLQRAGTAYKEFFRFFFVNDKPLVTCGYIALFAACVLLGAYLAWMRGVHRDWKRLACSIGMTLLLPLACASIHLMTDTVPLRTMFAFAFPYLICALLLDRMDFRDGEKKLLRWIGLSVQALALAACLLLSYCNAMQANELYLNSDVTNKTAFSWYTRLASRIEEKAGYKTEYNVCFVGTPRQPTVPDGFSFSTLAREKEILRYCSWYCGINLVKVSDEKAAELQELYGDRIEKMPSYPLEGSVQVIKGVVVVKFGTGSEDGSALREEDEPPADTVDKTPGLEVSGVAADVSSAKTGEGVTWTAAASGGEAPYTYCFCIYKDGEEIKTSGYHDADAYRYTPWETGVYTVKVIVKDAAGKKSSAMGGEVTVTQGAFPLEVSGIAADVSSAKTGQSVTWTAAASGGEAPYTYCFCVYKDGEQVKRSGYRDADAYSYTPWETGVYTVKVIVRDAAGKTRSDTGGEVTVTLGAVLLEVSGIAPDVASARTGEGITWTAAATGGEAPYAYCFCVYRDGELVKKSGYRASDAFRYTPTEAGVYSVKVIVRDAEGKTKSARSEEVTVTPGAPPPEVAGIAPDVTSAKTGEGITWTAAASGGEAPYTYCFCVYKDGEQVKTSGYHDAGSYRYTPTETGVYTAKVIVKDAAGKKSSAMSGEVTVTQGAPGLEVSGIAADKTSARTGESITWTAAASGGEAPYTYCFCIYKDGEQVKTSGYHDAAAYRYTPAEPGVYTAKVIVRDAAGKTRSERSAEVTVT